MIASPDHLVSLSLVTEMLIVVKREALLIEEHDNEHVANGKLVLRDNYSCPYCLKFSVRDSPTLQEKKKPETLNQIERMAEMSGKSAYVALPRSWIGKKVAIVLVDD